MFKINDKVKVSRTHLRYCCNIVRTTNNRYLKQGYTEYIMKYANRVGVIVDIEAYYHDNVIVSFLDGGAADPFHKDHLDKVS